MLPIDSIFSDFYAAAAGRLDWRKPFSELSRLMDLWGVQVIGVDKKTGGLIFSAEGGRASPESALDYMRSFHLVNPRIDPALATPADQWMHCHEHFNDAYVASSAFYQDFLIPYGGRYLSGTKLIDNDEVLFMLGIMRGHGSSPLGPDDLPLLQRIKHHLTEAFSNFVHMRETYVEAGMGKELLNQFDYPMLLIDEMRGIWHGNRSGKRMLLAGDTVMDKAGVLVCRDRQSDNELTEIIHSLQLNSPGGSNPVKRAMSITNNNGRQCLAFVSVLRPEQTMGAFGNASRALIVLHDSGNTRALDPFILAECFDLTPAEARVAVQIAGGANAKEIAQNQSIALPTVRTHIQRVMEKTGVDRQVDLVRVLMALPVRA
ncbi:MAG: helix-turn-helix transcriptional regulator [Pseudomonadota bacterium]